MKLERTNIITGKIDSGKTRGILFNEVNEIIKRDESLVVLDLKEEYYNNYSKLLQDKGYQITVVNLNNPLNSNGFNPFTMPYHYYKYSNIDKCIELLEDFGLRLFNEDSANIDPFWSNSAKDLFVGLSLILFKEAKEEEINLGSITSLLNALAKDGLNSYFEALKPNDPIYISASAVIYSPTDTKGSIISVLKQKLNQFIIKPNLLNLLSNTNFDINNFGSKKTALFIIPKEDSRVNNIANILIDQIIYKIKENKLTLNLILDNIDVLGAIYSLNSLINMAYSNINLTIVTRDIDLLNALYGANTFKNILNVIDTNKQTFEISKISNNPIPLPTLNQDIKLFEFNK